jgi:hypothetical protein
MKLRVYFLLKSLSIIGLVAPRRRVSAIARVRAQHRKLPSGRSGTPVAP